MSEIDLFPEDLRKQLMFTRWFKITGVVCIGITILFVLATLFLREANAQFEAQIERFQAQQEITTANRQQLEQLSQQKTNLQQQMDLLSGLRSGASAEKMFLMIDRAMPGPEVWLTNWRFRRAGTPVDEAAGTVSTGYFIVIPAGSQGNRQEETWQIETNMTIQGQAMDHVAMSKFVLNLTQQPEIDDVRIVNSRQTTVNRVKLVDFSLDIVVSTREGSG